MVAALAGVVVASVVTAVASAVIVVVSVADAVAVVIVVVSEVVAVTAAVADVVHLAAVVVALEVFARAYNVLSALVLTCSWDTAGMKGGSKVLVEPHRHSGVFIARGKEDALVTKNTVPGESVSWREAHCSSGTAHYINMRRFAISNGRLSRRARTRSNIACGTSSAQRLLRLLWVVLITYIFSLAKVLYLGAIWHSLCPAADIVGPVPLSPFCCAFCIHVLLF